QDFEDVYGVIFDGDKDWQDLKAPQGQDFSWKEDSTYVQEAPFFRNITDEPAPVTDIQGARVLLYLGDSVTTDHISPAGSFKADSAAGQYLLSLGVSPKDFNSYGSRRGNHEVMMRGTFANVRIRNKITEKEGGYTTYFGSGETMNVYD